MTYLPLLFLLVCSTDDPPVDYATDVKPLLARHCVACHGAVKPRLNLRLDTAKAVHTGGTSGPAVIAGQPDESLLLLAVTGEGGGERMPLKRPALSATEIDVLRRWIQAGAPGPESEVPSSGGQDLWAFEPPVKRVLPEVVNKGWCRNTIDHFILARLEREGLTPSESADRVTLLRRVTLDLIGLPPSESQMQDFLDDERPDAYERAVDRLLASPHYGERWARPWLDLARYADSNGYSIDAPRSIWPYRDWVISALNVDMPYDQFATWQLAGDLVPKAPIDALVATGFHRNTPINQEGGIDREQFRVESTIDRANTTAAVFLGLTMGCAACHDHKYDPITQKEYYQFYAFFNNLDEPDAHVASPAEVARFEAVQVRAVQYLDRLWAEEPALKDAMRAWELGLDMVGRQKQSQEVREAFDVPFEKRDEAKLRVVFSAFIDQAEEARTHKQALDQLRAEAPALVKTMIVKERDGDRRPTHLLVQGDFTRPAEPLAADVPRVLPKLGPATPHTRLDLATWLFHADQPLTARVAINRLWQTHFGRGLVETENDFGTQGAPPSHPELLDWLACEFRESGYGLKAIHRLVVTSATYRQSSSASQTAWSRDPSNRWLSRQARLRLDAELIRDNALAASGLLCETMGGPSVYPPQPDGVMTLGQMRREWVADLGPNRYRRGVYTFLWRATPHPLLSVFDAPDPTKCSTRRERSNTPLQALMLLNDAMFLECAEALANQLDMLDPSSDESKIGYLFNHCIGRLPTPAELGVLRKLLLEARRNVVEKSQSTATSERRAWVSLARVVLNLDEFLTRE
jgi:mono/diheme cytochrome c family protein